MLYSKSLYRELFCIILISVFVLILVMVGTKQLQYISILAPVSHCHVKLSILYILEQQTQQTTTTKSQGQIHDMHILNYLEMFHILIIHV